MNIAIVEDELLAADYLKGLLATQSVIPIHKVTCLRSVQQAIDFLQNEKVDLIFMDIHLGDGKSFDIFKEVEINSPIIFITAYDNYAIQVFKQFTIDYILKPFEATDLEQALQKFVSIRSSFHPTATLDTMVSLENTILTEGGVSLNRFLVNNGYKLISVDEKEVAYFSASGKYLFLYTVDGNSYIYDDTIRDISRRLNPSLFFKINRKFIINIHSIEEIIRHSSQKIELKLKSVLEEEAPILISKNIIPSFKTWLGQQ